MGKYKFRLILTYIKELPMKRDDDNKKMSRDVSETPSFTRPVWQNPDMNCKECGYNEQDIDTFPCAKCHTRH